MHYFIFAVLSLFLYSCRAPIVEQRLTDESIDWYACQIKQLKDFDVVDCTPEIEDDLTKLSLTVVSKQELDQTNARISLVESVEEFIRYFNKDKDIRPFLHTFPFTFQQMEFTILFQPQPAQLAASPSIAKATLINGQAVYYMQDETQESLQIVYQEPYLEAWKIASATWGEYRPK